MKQEMEFIDPNIIQGGVYEDNNGKFSLCIVMKTPNETFISEAELREALEEIEASR